MKNIILLTALAILASCGGGSETAPAVDSLATDSVAVDSVVAKVDTAKVDTVATPIKK